MIVSRILAFYINFVLLVSQVMFFKIQNYLSDRKQRIVLPGFSSAWNFIKAGVPLGSILVLLPFLVHINVIVTDIGSNIRLFADDTSLYIIVDNPLVAAETLIVDLEKISRWAVTWLVTFNPNKSITLLLSCKVSHLLSILAYFSLMTVLGINTYIISKRRFGLEFT